MCAAEDGAVQLKEGQIGAWMPVLSSFLFFFLAHAHADAFGRWLSDARALGGSGVQVSLMPQCVRGFAEHVSRSKAAVS